MVQYKIRYTIHLVVFFVFFNINEFAQANESTNFIHLTATLGREQANAQSVIEDSLGYLWLQSSAGLLRFDGYDFVPHSVEAIFGKQTNHASLLGLTKDTEGHIWCISTKGGISKLLASGKFTTQQYSLPSFTEEQELACKHMGKSTLWLGSNCGTLTGIHLQDSSIVQFDIQSADERIITISEGKNNRVWFSTNKGRVFNADLASKVISELQLPYNNPFNTTILTCDHQGNLWIGTELFGFFYYNIKTGIFKQYHNKAQGLYFAPSNMVIRILCDSKGIIWMGTDGGGLYRVNPRTKELKVFKHSKTNPSSIQSNTVIGLSETDNNDIWVFTNYGNINILPEESTTVGYHSGSISGSPSRVLSILKTKDETLWIGTDGEGINLVDRNGNPIRQFVANSASPHSLPGNYIQAMAEDKNGNIWVGTYLNGLCMYNHQKDTFTPIRAVNNSGQQATDIRSLFIDYHQRVWVGSNVGIFVYSIEGTELAFFPYNANGLQGSIVEVFIEDEHSQLWIGTNMGGIALLRESETLTHSSFTTYKLYDTVNQLANSINHGAADYNGHLYLVNSHTQLIKFNIKTKENVPIQGIAASDLQGALAVSVIDPNNIWVSKPNGISHLDLAEKEDYFYSWKNGTLKGSFLSGSILNDKNQKLYFGGVGGLNYFNPQEMKTTKKQLQLCINQLKIVNRNAKEIIPIQLRDGIEHLKNLELNHKQTSFSFGYSVINDYLDPNYFYAYRLKGFDKDWISTENKRIATYTNIPYGDYTFEVKAGTKRNVWDIEPRTLHLKILPPLWYRWWAIIIYIILFLSISFFLVRYSIMWARLKKKLVMEEWQNEKNKELYDLKMNFFAKMSHEIQTPLTLILSPLEDMIEKAADNLLLSQRLKVIRNNAKRLSRISLELMTIRNKELGKLRLKASEHNIAQDIEQIAMSFMEQARFKHIDFNIEGTSAKKIMVWYDKEKLEHVIYNLLANAFKFTSREGKITLRVNQNQATQTVGMQVTDTGIGIPEKDLKNIFNIFYQSPTGKAVGGTGIGLALTYELIELHRGKIEVVSEVNKGTSFTISLPLGKAHLNQDEIVSIETNEDKEDMTTKNNIAIEEVNEHAVSDETRKNILLVEDNYEMLMFLTDSFKTNYNVHAAQNGKEALDSITEFKPDIIVSDVMMPIMDGITLCKTLKEKQSTRHIPIILLTTKNTTNAKLEGLKFGAIEYINKPFNLKELLLKVNNIIDAQIRYIEQYRAEILTESKELVVESPDEKFIELVLVELEKNFEDPEFRLEELATTLNMSYSYIYRKFQSLTGKTLVDFVRSFRLRKAVCLLENYNFTIAEIAFRVGFNDPKYFSKCFKREYKKTPKQFRLDAEITKTQQTYTSNSTNNS